MWVTRLTLVNQGPPSISRILRPTNITKYTVVCSYADDVAVFMGGIMGTMYVHMHWRHVSMPTKIPPSAASSMVKSGCIMTALNGQLNRSVASQVHNCGE